MIRLVQKKLIIPRGDTGEFILPAKSTTNTGDVAVFSIIDPRTHTKVYEQIVDAEGENITISFEHNDTVNLPIGRYVWDVKFYINPIYVDEKLVNGDEVDSYYAAYNLPECEIKPTGDNLLTSDDAPTTTLTPNTLNLLNATVTEATRQVGLAAEQAHNAELSAGAAANSAVAAEGYVGQITGLSATATTLGPNDNATASYNSTTGILTIGVPQGNGIQSIVMNADYTLTVTYTNGQFFTTVPIKGDTGDAFHIVKTYNSIAVMNADYNGTEVQIGEFVMIVSNVEDPDNAKVYVKGNEAYNFVVDMSGSAGIQGQPGPTGVGITSIVKTETNNLIDTYTITFSNGNNTSFNVVNGNGISTITKTSTSGLIDTYTITMQNGNVSTFTVTNGATPSFSIGTVQEGINANATITGTDINPVLNLTLPTANVTGKADKVNGALSGNFAALDSNGNLVDSGHKHADYLTMHQDIPVRDVQINNTSIVTNNVANIPLATNSTVGVVQGNNTYGTGITANGDIMIVRADESAIKSGANEYKPITPYTEHQATFYGLAAAAGDTTQKLSSNAVGTYTNDAKTAIKNMLGVTDYSSSINQLVNQVTAVETQKANNNGSYEAMTVGTAQKLSIEDEINDTNPYLLRKTIEGNYDKEEDILIGGTVAWNQLCTRPASATTINGITLTPNADGSISFSGTAATTYVTVGNIHLTAGHVYMYRRQSAAGAWATYYAQYFQTSASYDDYRIISASAENVTSLYFGLYFLNTTDESSGTVTFQCIDLTQMFGSTIADYIYSLEQANAGAGVAFFRKLFPKPYYAYNAGELMHVQTSGHKMVGFNQWDGTKVTGKRVNSSTGLEELASSYSCTDYVKVLPNTTYYFKNVCGNTYCSLVWYDADKKKISNNTIGNGSKVSGTNVSPSNAYYVRINLVNSQGSDETCLSLHWDGERDGEYEPYEEHTYPLDSDLVLRGVPQLDANNNLYYDGDEYASDGTVERDYVEVEVTSCSSVSTASTGVKVATVIIEDTAVTESSSNGFLSDKYAFRINAPSTSGWFRVNPAAIYIYDNRFTDKETANSILASEKPRFVYKKATPTTESADSFTRLQSVSPYGTEEYIDTRAVAIPVGHHTNYLLSNSGGNKLETLPNLTENNGLYIIQQIGKRMELISAPSTDNTLSIANTPADSKATGDAIAAVEAEIPTVDATLATTGAAADAKKTGQEIANLKSAIQVLADYISSTIISDPAELQRVVSAGRIADYLQIGDVVVIPWTDNNPSTPVTYQYPFVVVKIGDVYDNNGVLHHNALWLQARYATNIDMVFDAAEAIEATEETFTEGWYYYTKNEDNSYKQATVTYGDAIPAGTTYYHHKLSGATGLLRYGYNRWSKSAYRQWLNSGAAKNANWWTAQHDCDVAPSSTYTNKAGWLNGFTADWLSIIKPVKVQTACNTVTDGGVTDTTYDRFFLPSLEQVYGSPQVSGVEGDYWEWWKDVTGLESPSNGSAQNPNDARKIPAVNAPAGNAVTCWLRSAKRGGATNEWNVSSAGYLNGNAASYALRGLPACVIY